MPKPRRSFPSRNSGAWRPDCWVESCLLRRECAGRGRKSDEQRRTECFQARPPPAEPDPASSHQRECDRHGSADVCVDQRATSEIGDAETKSASNAAATASTIATTAGDASGSAARRRSTRAARQRRRRPAPASMPSRNATAYARRLQPAENDGGAPWPNAGWWRRAQCARSEWRTRQEQQRAECVEPGGGRPTNQRDRTSI